MRGFLVQRRGNTAPAVGVDVTRVTDVYRRNIFKKLQKVVKINGPNVLCATKDALKQPRGIRGSWARRLSRLSDGLDAHVEVVSRKKNSITQSTVWEYS
ncbi:hypothetical protein HUJ05_005937 [Dendroctonus ponderosae]|nr:hypothetical protein HUJ05_005937 [Dendroctonus ponderosae]